MGEYTIKYLIDYYQSFVTIEQTIHMNSATVYIVAYISLCICVDALVEDISRIEIGNSEDYLQFTFMNYCQIIFQRSCSNLGFHLQSMRFLFPGCAFFQPMMLAHFKRTAYIAVLFSKYTKLWSFSLLVYQTYATLISLPSTLIRLSSPSPVLRGESLPRVKASFLLLEKSWSLCDGANSFYPLCYGMFLRWAGTVLERLRALELDGPGALGLNPTPLAADCVCS